MAGKPTKDLRVSESGFLFDPRTGHTFSLNPVGALAFRLAQEGKTAEEIAGRLASEYDVSEREALKDAGDFLASLRSYGLCR